MKNLRLEEKVDFCGDFEKIVRLQHEKKQKRDIWKNSRWKYVSNLDCDDVGKIGEYMIGKLCKKLDIDSIIDGKIPYFNCDGYINKRTVEIKTSRLGSNSKTFQHELGENPWNAEFMIFFDISPSKIYLTIFPNFSEAFYKKSGNNCKIKSYPVFKSRSMCWRKKSGAFKLDTSIDINENNKKYTFIIEDEILTDFEELKKFLEKSIPGRNDL